MPTKCNSCGGTYETTQLNGTRYFHVCSPIPNPAFNTDPKKGPVDQRDTIERPNKRDENLASVDPKTGLVTIKSEGGGTTEV